MSFDPCEVYRFHILVSLELQIKHTLNRRSQNLSKINCHRIENNVTYFECNSMLSSYIDIVFLCNVRSGLTTLKGQGKSNELTSGGG